MAAALFTSFFTWLLAWLFVGVALARVFDIKVADNAITAAVVGDIQCGIGP